jgi:cellulose synthase/poly-beta-1,6-N-acetylglucosamine synthase-like glycosyltransferase
MIVLFWLALLVIVYTYAGYPLVVAALARRRGRPVGRAPVTPKVSVVVAAYNEAARIGAKIENLLSLDYPGDRIEILVGSDGSTDDTEAIVAEYAAQGSMGRPPVRLYRAPERRGKAALLGELVPFARGEIVLFSDVRQRFEPDAVRRLVANFADPEVGCASGALWVERSPGGPARALAGYRAYDQFLRRCESALHSTPGATGALYAIRRELFVAPAPDTILDDMAIPLAIVARGKRAIFDPSAIALDPAPATMAEEFRRKARTLAGCFQLLWRFRGMLNPWRSPVAWPLLARKLLRLVVPYCLLVCLAVSGSLAAGSALYSGLLAAQALFYGAALLGAVCEWRRWPQPRAASVAWSFLALNVAAVVGPVRYALGQESALWRHGPWTVDRRLTSNTVYGPRSTVAPEGQGVQRP